MGEGRTTKGIQLISHDAPSLEMWKSELRIVDRTAIALPAGGFLRVFQAAAQVGQLRLQVGNLPLTFFFTVVPNGLIGGIGEDRMQRIRQSVDMPLYLRNRILQLQCMVFPVFGGAFDFMDDGRTEIAAIWRGRSRRGRG